MMTAQAATVPARSGVADELAAGPLTAVHLAPRVAADPDALSPLLSGRERTRAEHEALLGPEGYELVRDTPVAAVLPWRVLEFQPV